MSQATRPIDYRNKKALVVDDYPSMRTAFKMALASFGMTKVDVAASAAEAIGRVKTVVYDIIICDYNLGEGRDGQQLLEEMRHDYLIGLETVFLMVTAESVYQRVVAAAELAPDDYLIKPFNGEILRTRLDAILAKKEAFAEVYRNFAREDLEASMAACDVLMKQQPKYFVDALRFKGEILVAMGNFEGAEAIYRQVTAMRAVPWSRLCLARALHLQRKEAAAEEILLDLVEQNPELVASYDLLADVQLAQNKLGDAQSTLQRGVEVSGKSPRRQRRLGEVAYQNNDLKTAETAFRAAVDKGRNSIFQGANDFANLCRVHLDQGDTKAAAEVIAKNRKLLQESDEGKLVAAVVLGQINERNGRYGEARTHMTEAAALLRRGIQCEPELALGMVETCVKVGMDEEAAAVLSEVARNGHDSAALLEKAKRIYQEAGKEAAVAQILRQATERVATLSKEGALLMQRGDLKNGVAKLLLAATEAPRNPRVLMNTTWAILRMIEQDGDSGDMLTQARRLLDDVAYLAPGHPRLADLRTSLRNIGSQRPV
jgi:CheY-like chemotaxis protein